MTTPVSGTGATSVASVLAAAKATAAGAPKDQMGKDTFLKLLVAQMKYQNPMSPTDGTQFLAQTAQFSMVEKLNDLATQNAQLITAGELSSATGLVGRTVSWAGEDAGVQSGVVTGARFTATGPVLTVGTKEVALTAVQSVTAQPTAAQPAAPAPAAPAPGATTSTTTGPTTGTATSTTTSTTTGPTTGTATPTPTAPAPQAASPFSGPERT